MTQETCTEAASRCIQAARKRCTMDNVLVLVMNFQWRPGASSAARSPTVAAADAAGAPPS